MYIVAQTVGCDASAHSRWVDNKRAWGLGADPPLGSVRGEVSWPHRSCETAWGGTGRRGKGCEVWRLLCHETSSVRHTVHLGLHLTEQLTADVETPLISPDNQEPLALYPEICMEAVDQSDWIDTMRDGSTGSSSKAWYVNLYKQDVKCQAVNKWNGITDTVVW